jgi:hypothetical protein
MKLTFHLERNKFEMWRPQNNPGGPLTLVREGTKSALQFTYAQYKGPKALDLSAESLIRLAENGIQKIRNPREKFTGSGACIFGKFGTVQLKGGSPIHFQAWALWNGHDQVIYATHSADSEPSAQETNEALQIVMATTLQ